MTRPKPINFKPLELDQKYLDVMKDENDFKTTSEMIRYCIHRAFQADYGEEKYNQILLELSKLK